MLGFVASETTTASEAPASDEEATRWLTDEEMRAWLAYIDLSSLLSDYLDRQLHRDSGMSHTTFHLLARLSGAPERALGLTALAENLRITRSRLSHALAKLEQAGWIVRIDDPNDKRGQLAALTDRGAEALAAAAPGHTAAVRHDPHAPPFPDELPWRRR
jgi:DNA-binding MarR family transcriptional regulator